VALSGKAGILDDMQYKAQETQLAPQETLLLFTDGLTEALRSA
jgi:serine phosphatase RsbU (regulator of sigma subunit)